MYIDITNSKLHLLHWEHNGNIFTYNIESYWKIGDTYLYVRNYYSYDTNYTIVDNYFNVENVNEHTFNILYTKTHWIERNISYNLFKIENTDVKVLNREFKIDSPDILIKIISELPKRVLASNKYIENINKCKIKERNLAIDNIISSS